MAGWQQAVELAMTGGKPALSRRAEARSRVSGDAVRLRERPVGRLGVHHQTVQRCVERAVANGGPRRPTATGQGADDPAGSQGLAGVAGVRQGQGARLSARVVDDAAVGPACARDGPAGGGAGIV